MTLAWDETPQPRYHLGYMQAFSRLAGKATHPQRENNTMSEDVTFEDATTEYATTAQQRGRPVANPDAGAGKRLEAGGWLLRDHEDFR